MRRILVIVFIPFIMLFMTVPMRTSAEYEREQSEIEEEVDNILSDYELDWSIGDVSGITFGELWNRIMASVSDRLGAPLRLLGTLLAVIIFSAVVRGLGDGTLNNGSNAGLYNMVCVLTAVTTIAPLLFVVYENAVNAVERTGGFMLVFVPVFAGITIACGGTLSGGVYSVMILGASELFTALTDRYLIPVLGAVSVLAVSGSVFPNVSVDGIVKLIKKIITWAMTVSMTLFTGFAVMKCTLAAKTDGVAVKTAKYIISGVVPIVGGAVSDAYTTIKGSFDVMRSTVGTAGNIAIILFILPPVIEILIFRGVMWISTAAAELLSSDALVRLMKAIDSSLAIVQSVLICYSVMLIICTGILIQSFV